MSRHSADDGFSLVELIIAMFFLAILSLAVLPLLIGAASTSTVNRDHVKATAFATEQVATLRAAFPLDSAAPCTTLAAKKTPPGAPVAGPSGSGMTAAISVGSCPVASAAYPASIAVTVTVFDSAGDTLTALPTQIRVAAP